MPYIKEEDREKFSSLENTDGPLVKIGSLCQSAGELNYCFTIIAQAYLKSKGLNYQHINDIVGALEGAKMEFYRRIAAKYEDEKIELNGDVCLFNAYRF